MGAIAQGGSERAFPTPPYDSMNRSASTSQANMLLGEGSSISSTSISQRVTNTVREVNFQILADLLAVMSLQKIQFLSVGLLWWNG